MRWGWPECANVSVARAGSCRRSSTWKFGTLCWWRTGADVSTRQDVRDHSGSVAALPLLTDDGLDLEVALELAMQHHLSLYDAVYLELAKRRAATLATLDRALLRAAAEEQIAVVEVPSDLA